MRIMKMKTTAQMTQAINNLMNRIKNPELDEDSKNTAMGALAGIAWVMELEGVPERVRETLDANQFNPEDN